MTPSGTQLLGLVKHLASVEYGWFCTTFGRPGDEVPFDDNDADADMRALPDEATADILAYYARARAAADQAIAETAPEETGTAWFGEPVLMRWVLIHMVEDGSPVGPARRCRGIHPERRRAAGRVRGLRSRGVQGAAATGRPVERHPVRRPFHGSVRLVLDAAGSSNSISSRWPRSGFDLLRRAAPT